MTLMVVHTRKQQQADKEELISILESGDRSNTNRAIEIFSKYDSITYARDIALENETRLSSMDMMDSSLLRSALQSG